VVEERIRSTGRASGHKYSSPVTPSTSLLLSDKDMVVWCEGGWMERDSEGENG